MIPYAVSLALSVSYRKMRHSCVPMFKVRGKREFVANTALLKELAETFWTARTMAAMAEQVLQEMDKVIASMVQEPSLNDHQQSRLGNAEGGPGPSETNLHLHPTPREEIRFNLMRLDNDGGDVSIFEAAPNIDVFGHFDPTFNLPAVDAALQGNLDFGNSSNWYDWQQTWG